MKIEHEDNGIERMILMAMVTSTRFLKEIQTLYKPEYLESSFERWVAEAALEHFAKHGTAPKRHMQDIFNLRKSKFKKKEEAKLVEQFLEGLSSEYDRKTNGAGSLNVQFLVEETERLWQDKDLGYLSDEIKELAKTDPVKAIEMLREYKPPMRGGSRGSEPLKDMDAFAEAFDSEAEPLLRFRGALGHLINPLFCRDSFVGVLGREKIGKTFFLTEVVMRAIMAGNNTVLIQAGDMSRNQILRRLASRIVGKPSSRRYLGAFKEPLLTCEHDIRAKGVCKDCQALRNATGHFPAKLTYRVREYEDIVSMQDIKKAADKILRHLKSRKFKMIVEPMGTLTMPKVDETLEYWKDTEGFIPDVIVGDHMDIFASHESNKDSRHNENAKWKAGRALTQKWHACGVFATQADADAFEAETLTFKNFSEDKRKFGHVTSFLSLNQTEEERQKRLWRIAVLMGRDFDNSCGANQAVCLQNLRVNNPHLDSYYRGDDGEAESIGEEAQEHNE